MLCPKCNSEIRGGAQKCKYCKEFILISPENTQIVSRKKRNIPIWLWIFALVNFLIMIPIFGNIFRPMKDKPVFAREELIGLIMYKSTSEVMNLIGTPDSTQGVANCVPDCYWYYDYLTYDKITGKRDYNTQIRFKDGIVYGVH